MTLAYAFYIELQYRNIIKVTDFQIVCGIYILILDPISTFENNILKI